MAYMQAFGDCDPSRTHLLPRWSDLQQRMNWVARLGLNAGSDDRLPAVREHNDIARFDVGSGMFDCPYIVPSRVMEAVSERHVVPSRSLRSNSSSMYFGSLPSGKV